MSDLIKRSDAIDALNECEDIKGYAYTSMHDALMEIPSAKVIDAEALKVELSKAPVWTTLSVMEMIDKIERSRRYEQVGAKCGV